MPSCEMCGENQENLTTVNVSGATLRVCNTCSSFNDKSTEPEPSNDETNGGVDEPHSPSEAGKSMKKQSPEEGRRGLVSDYPSKIHEARKESRLSVKELAEKLDEEPIEIEEAESGEKPPGTTLRVKMEQFLNITLVKGNEVEWGSNGSDYLDGYAGNSGQNEPFKN